MPNFRESETAELKSKFNEDIITREIVAFLNARGGSIYIGVNDDGTVVGVDKIDEYLRRLSDIVSTKIEPTPSNLIRSSILVEGEGKLVIEITVSKGFHDIYCIKKYGFSQTGCPMRIGTTCKEINSTDIQLRYQKRFETSSDYMLQIPARYGDISFTTLQIALSQKGYHINPLSFEENYNLKNSNGEFNQLAELLSDDNNTHLLFVKFKGKTKAAISQRNNYGRTSLINSYYQLRNRLESENTCSSDTTVRPRKDTYLFDFDAVNEALINALVHNDWNINEPLISMFDDRLEILSHGGLPDKQTKEKFLRGVSVPRNRGLMRIFQDLEITEASGHGILKIIEVYGEEAFEIQDTFINVVIPFNRVESEIDNNIYLCDYEPKYIAITEEENRILGEMITNPKITQNELSEKLGCNIRTVARHIKRLQELKIVERIGSNKTGSWKVKK